MACQAVAGQFWKPAYAQVLRRGSLRHLLDRWRRLVEHLAIAPSIPAWKAGVYLSTPMLEEMESRAGIAPAFAALQAAA